MTAPTGSRNLRTARQAIDQAVQRAGPVGTALGLGLLSVPFVVWTLLQVPDAWKLANEGYVQGPIDWRPMTLVQAIVLTVAAVLPAAAAGGWSASRVRPSDRRFRVLVAIAVPWAVAVVLLPAVAWAVGVPLRAGIVCTFGCDVMLRSDQPWSGAVAYVQMALTGTFLFWGVAVAGAAVWVLGELQLRTAMILAVVFAHAEQHWVAILWGGGWLPYAALAAGVVIWARYFVPGWPAETRNPRRTSRPSRPGLPG